MKTPLLIDVKPSYSPVSPKEFKVVALRDCPTPEDIMLCDTPAKAAEYWRLHLQAAVQNLPTIVNGMREMKRDGAIEGYELALALALYVFKFRIPGAHKKSAIRLALERPFYARKVREIPGLWKLFSAA